MTWVRLRIALALVSLGVPGVVAVEQGGRTGGGGAWSIWALLVPLMLSAWGLVRRRPWGRWSGLAIAVAVLPWAAALTLGPSYGQPVDRPAVALAAAAVLLVALLGPGMFQAFEGRSETVDWSGRRMGLIRWTIVFNLASVFSLYFFVTRYEYGSGALIAIPAVMLGGLVVGVLLLAYQKTVGLLLLGLSCILFVPAGVYFVWREARDPLEAALFLAIFAPGVLLGWASLAVFGRPLWRYLRSE